MAVPDKLARVVDKVDGDSGYFSGIRPNGILESLLVWCGRNGRSGEDQFTGGHKPIDVEWLPIEDEESDQVQMNRVRLECERRALGGDASFLDGGAGSKRIQKSLYRINFKMSMIS